MAGPRGGIRRRARMENIALMQQWIADLQITQRLCSASISPTDELETEWKSMTRQSQITQARIAKEHRIISEVAQSTAKARRS